jgi:transcriptional regulator with XRE-family HTH domain
MQTVTEGIRSQLGQRVRELRLAYRATQEQLAERAGLSYKFIGEIERGKANPTVDTLYRLAKALRVEIHELLLSPDRQTGSQAVYRIGFHDVALIREALKSADRLLDRFGRPGTRKSTPKTRR